MPPSWLLSPPADLPWLSNELYPIFADPSKKKHILKNSGGAHVLSVRRGESFRCGSTAGGLERHRGGITAICLLFLINTKWRSLGGSRKTCFVIARLRR